MPAPLGPAPVLACPPSSFQEELTDKTRGCPAAVLPPHLHHRVPQAVPVLCRDSPAAQPSLATYREDRGEPAQTHLLVGADLGVHRHVLCSGLCKEKKVEGQRGNRPPPPGRGCGGSPCVTRGAAGMLLAEGWRESRFKGCWVRARARPCRSRGSPTEFLGVFLLWVWVEVSIASHPTVPPAPGAAGAGRLVPSQRTAVEGTC